MITASVYCSTKFAVEGFSECLKLEVAQFNIGVTIVEPVFFRTDFLDEKSIRYANNRISDYTDYVQKAHDLYRSNNHNQLGDPAKLAHALLQLSSSNDMPTRFAAGSDAYEYIGAGNKARVDELEQYKQLTLSTDHDN